MHHKDEEPMKILQLIAGVEFNGAAQDSCDLSKLIAEREVNEALARGEIPQSPINSALHILHKKEQAVQDYLTQYKMRTGLEYQSVFVGMGAATAVGEKQPGSMATLSSFGPRSRESCRWRHSVIFKLWWTLRNGPRLSFRSITGLSTWTAPRID